MVWNLYVGQMSQEVRGQRQDEKVGKRPVPEIRAASKVITVRYGYNYIGRIANDVLEEADCPCVALCKKKKSEIIRNRVPKHMKIRFL